MVKYLQIKILLIIALLPVPALTYGTGTLIPTDKSQADFLKAYKFSLYQSHVDYRFTNSTLDSVLFPKFGEFSVYWVKSGQNKGSFVYPDKLPSDYSSVTGSNFENYNWQNDEHYALQFKHNTKYIAVFRSNVLKNNNSVSWASLYYKNAFDSYFYNNFYYFINERELDSGNINSSTTLLIIPPFTANGTDNGFYIDIIANAHPQIKARLDAFLASGGTIYAEGNAVYFLERMGYLTKNSVDFKKSVSSDPKTNLIDLTFSASKHPLSFTADAVDNQVYAGSVPTVDVGAAEVIASETQSNIPVVFYITGTQANGGRIMCNTGIPTIGGSNELRSGSRQLQWMFNALFSAFAKNIDVTRSIFNDLPSGITAGKNAISYDRIDTFEVRIKIRNLSENTVTGIQVTEYFRDYFKFVDVTTQGVTFTQSGSYVQFTNLSVAPKTEMVIVYRLRTPDPDDAIHEKVNQYISWANYIYTSYLVTTYQENGPNVFVKYRNYVDLMFSAFLAADTDLNWKNFLYLNYQPFKVFMIMENKERTPANETKYVQYIPKDVPFYWTDNNINIPILKTPGGKYVDILKGSNDESKPDFDQDGDGHPDAWLDTASIYPKNYTITEESVYWLNPWERFRSGDTAYYEDINHDGIRAKDLNGDGIVDVEAPGDKIRVWKVTWNIGKVAGYEYFDPYCSYEIWVDPPDLVPLSAGVGYANKKCGSMNGMFYPYSKDINNPNLSDTSWTHWMERDNNGNVIWKQFIYQKIKNYEGFTFIDTLKENYKLKPTDMCLGTVPQPHREFIAVLSLGGEEIDMTRYRPVKSMYSNIEYKTIFNETRKTPIRTTYTYYAPLPNPLQFEYLTNCYTITDQATGDTLKYLPEWGKANLTFEMDASTEYSYYWIRNAGHDVKYNDPSLKIEGFEELGDGVFGYMVYDIPKGLGGYKITLPKKADGTYDVDAIVQIDRKKFEKWLDNPNTKNEIEVLEDPYQYHIWIPQILIPPALDDDNHDGKDDWIDDRGDRFCSSTGFLRDPFMLGTGEQYINFPEKPFQDDIYGWVTKGWWCGPDSTYGDDFFETLGKTHITIHAVYEGKGKEGPIEISKGGWLVVEEIFGGSPWVIFSHTLSGFSQGVDYKLTSQAMPSVVKYGFDTTYIKHTVQDIGEPHYFNSDFEPWHVSYGYGESTVTTYVGGSDPCSLILPSITMPAIVGHKTDHKEITLVPYADKTNPDLQNYPKYLSGTFIEIRVEVMNGTDDNWVNTTVTPILPAELQQSEIVMQYVAYPRPLVPAQADPVTGKVLRDGDQIGAFKAGWRFNQPEGEVLVKMNESRPNKLNLLQPSRRAYFIFLVSLDESLNNGVYNINFLLSGERKKYDGTNVKSISYEVPPASFSRTNKNSNGTVLDYQKFIIGNGNLTNIKSLGTGFFKGMENVKWSMKDINNTNFDTIPDKLPSSYDKSTGIETIDLSRFRDFPKLDATRNTPKTDTTRFYILEQVEVSCSTGDDFIDVTKGEELNFSQPPFGNFKTTAVKQTLATMGPKVRDYKRINRINDRLLGEKDQVMLSGEEKKSIEVLVEVTNAGNDIAEGVQLNVTPGIYFTPTGCSEPYSYQLQTGILSVNAGLLIPGEKKELFITLEPNSRTCSCMFDTSMAINSIDITYKGKSKNGGTAAKDIYTYTDRAILDFPAPDLNMLSLSTSQPKLIMGSTSSLTATFQNGVKELENVTLRVFSVINSKDTNLISQVVFNKLEKFEKTQHIFDYKLPDSTYFIEFFAKIDAENIINEMCENNNSKYLQVPVEADFWIKNVKSSPNPFFYQSEFSYVLPEDMQNITISVFTVDSKPIDRIVNCPFTRGGHTVHWDAPEMAKGIYFFRITGINSKGNQEEYLGKIVKDR